MSYPAFGMAKRVIQFGENCTRSQSNVMLILVETFRT